MTAKKIVIWSIVIIVGLFAIAAASEDDEPTVKEPTVTKTTKPEKTGPIVYSDGTYEIGVDIKSGKYVSKSDDCYWQITKDANGSNIVNNGFQSGQQIVSLKKGQFFTVQNCSFVKS